MFIMKIKNNHLLNGQQMQEKAIKLKSTIYNISPCQIWTATRLLISGPSVGDSCKSSPALRYSMNANTKGPQSPVPDACCGTPVTLETVRSSVRGTIPRRVQNSVADNRCGMYIVKGLQKFMTRSSVFALCCESKILKCHAGRSNCAQTQWHPPKLRGMYTWNT